MPSKKPEGEFRVGEKVRVNLHAGKIVDATLMVKKLEWIEIAQLKVCSILFKSLSLKLP
jgi:hypothetical protein